MLEGQAKKADRHLAGLLPGLPLLPVRHLDCLVALRLVLEPGAKLRLGH